MASNEIIDFCSENGFLIDNEVLSLFNEMSDTSSIKIILNKFKNNLQKRVLTKRVFCENKEEVNQVFSTLPEEKQKNLESLRIKLGLSIEISKEKKQIIEKDNKTNFVKLVSKIPSPTNNKLEVKDFVNYFKARFNILKEILINNPKLTNLTSINKLSGSNQGVSIISLISDKHKTKNGNLIFEVEDLTGKIKILVSKGKQELFEQAEQIPLDAVVGFKGAGNKEIIFANEIILPKAILPSRKKSSFDESVAFIGDLHIGSSRFMEDKFLRFVDYLNCNVKGKEAEAKKIKYLFLVGDLIAGVGNYPGQEFELSLGDIEIQFEKAAELLSKIRSDIKIIISPGNHDGVRLMEPQPLFNEKFAWRLYNMKNIILTPNPAQVNIGSYADFDGFNILTYHGFSYFYYGDNIISLLLKKAAHNPEMIMKYLLDYSHLAPTHASVQYYPGEEDNHIIKDIPDILVSGHMHKSAVSYYNNILVVSVSAWESMTDYMEKRGAKPDFCKVPVFNLKTRAIKILDFDEEDHGFEGVSKNE